MRLPAGQCRTLAAGQLAHQQRGIISAPVPGIRHPGRERPGHPRPLCGPGRVTVGRAAAMSLAHRLPRPASRDITRARRARGRYVRPGEARQARNAAPTGTVRGRPWKSRRCTDRPHGPDDVRYTSVDTATRRLTVTHCDTRRDKKKTAPAARFRSQGAVSAGGGRCWVRTNGRLSRRFYRPFPLATRATCRMPQRWRHRKDSRRRDRAVSGMRLSG